MIFKEQISIKPDLYPWTEDFIRAMWEGHWTDREFNFSSDVQDFKVNLKNVEKESIIRTLSCIAQIEVAAVKTFWGKLGDNLPHPSIRGLGYVMANVETVHGLAYSRLLDVLGIEDVFEKNLKLDWVNGRVNYLRKYTHKFHNDNKKQFIYSLILFTLFVENVSLFSQFYVIKWFGRKNLLKDTNQQVSYTLREEHLHALTGIKLINTIKSEYPELFDEQLENKVLSEAVEAFKAESKIIDWMIDGINTDYLSPDILKEFVKGRINESLTQIGYREVFEIDQELIKKTVWFDEQNLGNGLTDFFHSRPVEYNKGGQSFDESDLF